MKNVQKAHPPSYEVIITYFHAKYQPAVPLSSGEAARDWKTKFIDKRRWREPKGFKNFFK
ncbi:hypothetical protein [Oscillibacter ruminantium]|uniref:hypothetical protein n=1 Tax=Oscillibacter ruminantium TaxID=1263547 RepID=UPI001181B5A2|nr:hypothetical protein [Oscillibacter ruminantium]MDN0032203.1 hypothetical protein [Oscillibacter valericigenes]